MLAVHLTIQNVTNYCDVFSNISMYDLYILAFADKKNVTSLY